MKIVYETWKNDFIIYMSMMLRTYLVNSIIVTYSILLVLDAHVWVDSEA